jgi:hypothetical protein
MVNYTNLEEKIDITLAYDCILPTSVLPNAMEPQTAIINFISSFNVGVFSNQVLTSNSQIFTDIFSYNLSYAQNCEILNIFNGVDLKNFFNFKQESVYNLHISNQNFIYPITPISDLNTFFGFPHNHNNNFRKTNGNYFWKNISSFTLDKIRKNNGVILIDYTTEPFIRHESYISIHKCLEASGIPSKNIFMMVNSFNAQEVYESWFDKTERKLEVRNYPSFLERTVELDKCFRDVGNNNMTLQTFLSTKNIIRDKKIQMKIRTPRNHRLYVLFSLLTDNLLDNFDFSYLDQNNLSNANRLNDFEKDKQFDYNKINEFYRKIPYYLKSENSDKTNVGLGSDTGVSYKDSYFNVCFESYYDLEYISPSEKIFQPILYFQPFVFVGFKGGLKLLKDLGFKTFDNVIDESYDSIENDEDRLEAAYNEIKKLCSLSKDEIHNLYWSLEDTLIFNYKHLTEFYNNKTAVYDILNEIKCKLKRSFL